MGGFGDLIYLRSAVEGLGSAAKGRIKRFFLWDFLNQVVRRLLRRFDASRRCRGLHKKERFGRCFAATTRNLAHHMGDLRSLRKSKLGSLDDLQERSETLRMCAYARFSFHSTTPSLEYDNFKKACFCSEGEAMSPGTGRTNNRGGAMAFT